MKNHALSIATAAACLFASCSAQAANVTGSYQVVVNLTPTCQIVTPIADLVLNYTSFGSAVQTNGSFNVKCTSNLAYSVSLDTAPAQVIPDVAAFWNYSDIGSGASAIPYSVSLTPPNRVGSGSNQSFALKASIAANVGGSCTGADTAYVAGAGAAPGTPCQFVRNRTVTVTF